MKSEQNNVTNLDDSKKLRKIEKLLDKMSDEECLIAFAMFLATRVSITTEFHQQDDVITHESLVMCINDKMVQSDPRPLNWPLQPMPMPEAFKGKVN